MTDVDMVKWTCPDCGAETWAPGLDVKVTCSDCDGDMEKENV